MMKYLLIAITLSAVAALTDSQDSVSNNFKVRRVRAIEVDPTFNRRYKSLERRFGSTGLNGAFLKYFIRNRAQRRERRQIDNRKRIPFNYYDGNFNNYRNQGQLNEVNVVKRQDTNIRNGNNRQPVRRQTPSPPIKRFRPPPVHF